MTNFIPLFPLNVVVFLGETLNLHIFEPRYIQLINDCIAEKKPFGILPVIDGRQEEMGMLMDITEVVTVYGNTQMDIRTKGKAIFRVLTPIDSIPDKLYGGAIVNYPENIMDRGTSTISQKILEEVKRLYVLMNLTEKFPLKDDSFTSYEIGHFLGLTTAQEYEFATMLQEIQRLEYIRRHLNSIYPVLKKLEEMKARIQLNGHFRDLSANDFKL